MNFSIFLLNAYYTELPGNALPHSLPCGREMGEKTAIPREQPVMNP